MSDHGPYMRRALHLARLGGGAVAPNPMVGAVLVRGGRVLAEGWHHRYGGPHAEVECLRAFGDGPVPDDAVLYVSLEPCSHQGRTPPCADLLIARGVRHVVVAHQDPFPLVSGKGIARLREAGVHVQVGLEEQEARWTNRRFLTAVVHGRPWVVLKWAESDDGFLDVGPAGDRRPARITSFATDVLTHGWRSAEQAIMVGARTVVNDDPALTVRHVPGPQPLRVVLDREGITPATSRVYDGTVPTLLFTAAPRSGLAVEQCIVPPGDGVLERVLGELHRRGVRSLYVEGGATLLGHFIARGLWDEARVITGAVRLGEGTPAPRLGVAPLRLGPTHPAPGATDRIAYHINPASPAAPPHPIPETWPW
jgi:diaminohydroxyphosphoribosylaminopyrimidine deaminase/5-amino-6-(5-phosphoribosylamino)uracil reductase